jgi:hypothetical protein
MATGRRIGAHRGFFDDVIIVLLLLNNARRKAVSTAFGLAGLNADESLLITLVALATLFGQAEEVVPIHRPAKPHLRNLVIGGSVVKELGHTVGGSDSREIPAFVGLIALALIWRYHPLARGSIRAARASLRAAEASERWIRTVYGGGRRAAGA